MKVIAICEYDNEYPIAVVQIPEGSTDDETFVKWYRLDHMNSKLSDQDILEQPFLWQELEVEQVS